MAIKETISTLKFAELAKRIKNKAVINEDSDEGKFKKLYMDCLKQLNLMKQRGVSPISAFTSSLQNETLDQSVIVKSDFDQINNNLNQV